MRGNWLVLSMVVAGCSATGDTGYNGVTTTSNSSTGALCIPGQQLECACPGGGKGAQKCRGDGTGFESCEGCGNAGSTSGGLGGATSSSSDGGHGGGSSSSMGGGGRSGGSSSASTSSSTGGHECSIATDCGATSYCLYRQCLEDRCSAKIAADGMELPKAQQTAGDCALLVCDGQGGTKSVYIEYDPASDGQECTADTCTPQGTTHPAKPTGTPCSTGLCNSSQVCVAHIPVKCQLKNGGAVYTGCDGIYHPGLVIGWSDGTTGGSCLGTDAESVYCPTGASCSVSVDGVDKGLGKCL